ATGLPIVDLCFCEYYSLRSAVIWLVWSYRPDSQSGMPDEDGVTATLHSERDYCHRRVRSLIAEAQLFRRVCSLSCAESDLIDVSNSLTSRDLSAARAWRSAMQMPFCSVRGFANCE